MSEDLSPIYRASAQEEPPAWLDEKIRAAARIAPLVADEKGWLERWGNPLAIAAVITLTSGTVWMMRTELPEAPADRQAPEAGVSEQPEESVVRETDRPLAVEPPGSVRRESTSAAKKASPTQGHSSAEKRQPGAPLVEGAPPEPRDGGTPASGALAESSANQPPAGVALPVPPAIAPGVQEESSPSRASPRSPKDAAASSRLGAEPNAEISENPERWLRQIEQLLDEGRAVEAGESLTAFRNRYPGFPLPERLRR